MIEPGQNRDMCFTREFRQQVSVGTTGRVRLLWIEKNCTRACRDNGRQRFQREPHLIDYSQFVARRDKNIRPESTDQFARAESLSQRAEQSTRAFHKRDLMAMGDAMDVRDNFSKLDTPAFLSGREQRRQRPAKMPRVDFIQRQRVPQRLAQDTRIVTTARADRFQRRNAGIARSQIRREQCREYGLTDTCSRAGDDDDAL